MSACSEKKLVDRHFAGKITVLDERTMRAHLPTCASCTAYYGRHLILAQLDPDALSAEDRIGRGLGLESAREPGLERLPSLDPPLAQVDPEPRSADERTRETGLGPRPPLPRARLARFAPYATAALALAAATLLFVRSRGDAGDGFTARGGPELPPSHVLVYDVAPGAPPKLAGTSVPRGDSLAFAYENGAAKANLMIFGVDENRRVYWFYPAWTQESDDPEAVPIQHDAALHMLPDAVQQDVEGTRLEVHALFTDATKLSVRQVEALLRDHPAGTIPLPGAVETTLTISLSAER